MSREAGTPRTSCHHLEMEPVDVDPKEWQERRLNHEEAHRQRGRRRRAQGQAAYNDAVEVLTGTTTPDVVKRAAQLYEETGYVGSNSGPGWAPPDPRPIADSADPEQR